MVASLVTCGIGLVLVGLWWSNRDSLDDRPMSRRLRPYLAAAAAVIVVSAIIFILASGQGNTYDVPGRTVP